MMHVCLGALCPMNGFAHLGASRHAGLGGGGRKFAIKSRICAGGAGEQRLRKMEGDVAAMTHDLGDDLDRRSRTGH
jgi:hypothetical protein